jgi:hypothetical protein
VIILSESQKMKLKIPSAEDGDAQESRFWTN